MDLAMTGEAMPTFPPSNRFMRLDLRIRKWLLGPLVRISLPVPVMWKRFLAPLWVFSLGIFQLCNTRPRELHVGALYRSRVEDFETLRSEIRRIVRPVLWFRFRQTRSTLRFGADCGAVVPQRPLCWRDG